MTGKYYHELLLFYKIEPLKNKQKGLLINKQNKQKQNVCMVRLYSICMFY